MDLVLGEIDLAAGLLPGIGGTMGTPVEFGYACIRLVGSVACKGQLNSVTRLIGRTTGAA